MKLWDLKIGRSSRDTYRIVLKNNPEVLKVSNQFRIDYKIGEKEEVSIDRSVLNSCLKEKIKNFDEVFFDPGLNAIEIYIRDNPNIRADIESAVREIRNILEEERRKFEGIGSALEKLL